jgi:hypothetical protein
MEMVISQLKILLINEYNINIFDPIIILWNITKIINKNQIFISLDCFSSIYYSILKFARDGHLSLSVNCSYLGDKICFHLKDNQMNQYNNILNII